jgi:hippurate hydrolase
VAAKLSEWGIPIHRGLGTTGVVGIVKAGSSDRAIVLRADMDALPMQEFNTFAHASQHPGKMHACGHDGHTAMLLAAAEHLATSATFDGTLNLIFQPAEESLGGARKMMEDGLFDRFPCDAIFAMHNLPGFRPGQLLLREGATMASSENILVHIEGAGGHGAMPHMSADPVVAGAAIVMALQTIVSRNVDPLKMAVITVGVFQAGVANNVIPQNAVLKLSVRALDRGVRALLRQRIVEVVELQAKSYGVTARVDFLPGYPVLVNTPAETEVAREVALALVGADNVVLQTEPLTASEDFAYMLDQVPGSYLFIGNGDATHGGHGACMVHNPNYDFEDRNIPVGAAFWVALTERYLVKYV